MPQNFLVKYQNCLKIESPIYASASAVYQCLRIHWCRNSREPQTNLILARLIHFRTALLLIGAEISVSNDQIIRLERRKQLAKRRSRRISAIKAASIALHCIQSELLQIAIGLYQATEYRTPTFGTC